MASFLHCILRSAECHQLPCQPVKAAGHCICPGVLAILDYLSCLTMGRLCPAPHPGGARLLIPRLQTESDQPHTLLRPMDLHHAAARTPSRLPVTGAEQKQGPRQGCQQCIHGAWGEVQKRVHGHLQDQSQPAAVERAIPMSPGCRRTRVERLGAKSWACHGTAV